MIILCEDDLYSRTAYNNDVAWIILSAKNTGNLNFNSKGL